MTKLKAEGDARGAHRRFRTEAQRLENELENIVREVGDDSELIFSAHALKDTGRMSRGVRSIPTGTTAVITVHAENPDTRFDYVAVTRFGHRVERIYPKHDVQNPGRYLAPTPRGPRWVDKKPALRIPKGNKHGGGFYASVRGFKPQGDWAQRALPEVERNASQALTRFGIRVTARLSG
jgi:hypothetical protein